MADSSSTNTEAKPIEEKPNHLARAGDVLPSILPILPVANRPFFPSQAMPLLIDESPWVKTLEAIHTSGNHLVGIILSRAENAEETAVDDLFHIGTVCRIHKIERTGDKIHLLLEGLQRFSVEQWTKDKSPFIARVRYYNEPKPDDNDEMRAYTVAIINTIKELLPLNPLYGEELQHFIKRFGANHPIQLTDFAASLTTSSKNELQEILETFDLLLRMEKTLVLLKKEHDVAKLQAQIQKKVEENINVRQREFFLREQLKAIQKELGISKDDKTNDVDKFREIAETLAFTTEAQTRFEEQIEKLSVLEAGSAEYTVTRNYLDWLTTLPWGHFSKDNLDLKRARETLDRHHSGIDDVKTRIIEFLGVGKMKGRVSGSIILLVGPPGVGKTSIGKSIAAALDREFYRFSLGGMRDEAEIKGHRRTYIGAMPGKFIQAIKTTKVANPVIMLDEIDKLSASYHGDPGSALLEVLDPEQNVEFLDHFLDVRFDLSNVLFICTANQLDTIPAPLLDRMEIIRLSGYTNDEKIDIAQNHLIPRQLEKVGLVHSQLKINKAAVEKVVDDYAREAGVRNLEKQLNTIARKAVIKILTGEPKPIKVGANDIESYLGKAPFQKEKLLTGTGVITGLAWTPVGGATLSIEAGKIHENNRGINLTGQLGDVMKESASIAYSYVSANYREYEKIGDFFDRGFIHLHVPAGATPKDGPSAGITMASALLSLALNLPAARPIAMTGELTLTGKVFPVGGIREKVVAAKRQKIVELILPEGNRADFDELPDNIREGLTVHFVTQFNEVARLLFPKMRKRKR